MPDRERAMPKSLTVRPPPRKSAIRQSARPNAMDLLHAVEIIVEGGPYNFECLMTSRVSNADKTKLTRKENILLFFRCNSRRADPNEAGRARALYAIATTLGKRSLYRIEGAHRNRQFKITGINPIDKMRIVRGGVPNGDIIYI
jgi:hypothetical protein